MMRRLFLSKSHWAGLTAESRYSLPNEICGILGGLDWKVLEVFPVRNVASEPWNSFSMDPMELLRVLNLLDVRGWEMLCVYHSHPPGSRTDPSDEDREIAVGYPGVLQVIIVPGEGDENPSMRVFEVVGQEYIPIPLVLFEGSGPK